MLFCTRVPPSVNGAKATLKNLERIGMAHALAAPDARAGFVENMDRRLFQGDVESDKVLDGCSFARCRLLEPSTMVYHGTVTVAPQGAAASPCSCVASIVPRAITPCLRKGAPCY
jgi:hypothetical protein